MQAIENIEKQEIEDDEHVLHLWQPLPELEIDQNYSFVPDSILFQMASTILYKIACPILWIWNKFWYRFSVTGIEKIEKVQGGKILVSNHIHPMDCTMNALLVAPDKIYFPTLKSNFQIPIVNGIIKLLHAIPIPDTMGGKKEFKNQISRLLQKGEVVHFYPEAALRPYYKKIRNFKKGAFQFAVENGVPIVPIIYTFSEVTGWRKIIRRKPLMDVTILDPVYPDLRKEKKEAIEILKESVWNQMNQVAEEKNIDQ